MDMPLPSVYIESSPVTPLKKTGSSSAKQTAHTSIWRNLTNAFAKTRVDFKTWNNPKLLVANCLESTVSGEENFTRNKYAKIWNKLFRSESRVKASSRFQKGDVKGPLSNIKASPKGYKAELSWGNSVTKKNGLVIIVKLPPGEEEVVDVTLEIEAVNENEPLGNDKTNCLQETESKTVFIGKLSHIPQVDVEKLVKLPLYVVDSSDNLILYPESSVPVKIRKSPENETETAKSGTGDSPPNRITLQENANQPEAHRSRFPVTFTRGVSTQPNIHRCTFTENHQVVRRKRRCPCGEQRSRIVAERLLGHHDVETPLRNLTKMCAVSRIHGMIFEDLIRYNSARFCNRCSMMMREVEEEGGFAVKRTSKFFVLGRRRRLEEGKERRLKDSSTLVAVEKKNKSVSMVEGKVTRFFRGIREIPRMSLRLMRGFVDRFLLEYLAKRPGDPPRLTHETREPTIENRIALKRFSQLFVGNQGGSCQLSDDASNVRLIGLQVDRGRNVPERRLTIALSHRCDVLRIILKMSEEQTTVLTIRCGEFRPEVRRNPMKCFEDSCALFTRIIVEMMNDLVGLQLPFCIKKVTNCANSQVVCMVNDDKPRASGKKMRLQDGGRMPLAQKSQKHFDLSRPPVEAVARPPPPKRLPKPCSFIVLDAAAGGTPEDEELLLYMSGRSNSRTYSTSDQETDGGEIPTGSMVPAVPSLERTVDVEDNYTSTSEEEVFPNAADKSRVIRKKSSSAFLVSVSRQMKKLDDGSEKSTYSDSTDVESDYSCDPEKLKSLKHKSKYRSLLELNSPEEVLEIERNVAENEKLIAMRKCFSEDLTKRDED